MVHRAGARLARGGPNMILDDGGDATLLVHKGAEFEKAGVVPSSDESDSESTGSSCTHCGNRSRTRPTASQRSLPGSRE